MYKKARPLLPLSIVIICYFMIIHFCLCIISSPFHKKNLYWSFLFSLVFLLFFFSLYHIIISRFNELIHSKLFHTHWASFTPSFSLYTRFPLTFTPFPSLPFPSLTFPFLSFPCVSFHLPCLPLLLALPGVTHSSVWMFVHTWVQFNILLQLLKL